MIPDQTMVIEVSPEFKVAVEQIAQISGMGGIKHTLTHLASMFYYQHIPLSPWTLRKICTFVKFNKWRGKEILSLAFEGNTPSKVIFENARRKFFILCGEKMRRSETAIALFAMGIILYKPQIKTLGISIEGLTD